MVGERSRAWVPLLGGGRAGAPAQKLWGGRAQTAKPQEWLEDEGPGDKRLGEPHDHLDFSPGVGLPVASRRTGVGCVWVWKEHLDTHVLVSCVEASL